MNIEDLFSLLCTLVTEFWQDLDGGSEDRRRNIIHNATKLIVVDIFAFHDSSSLMLQTLSSWYQPSQRVEAKPNIQCRDRCLTLSLTPAGSCVAALISRSSNVWFLFARSNVE